VADQVGAVGTRRSAVLRGLLALVTAVAVVAVTAPAADGATPHRSLELPGSAADPPDDGELIIRWSEAAGPAERARTRSAVAARNLGELPLIDAEVIALPPGASAAEVTRSLRARTAVLDVEPNVRFEVFDLTDDPFAELLWGLRNTGQQIRSHRGVSGVDISVADAWKTSRGTPETVVAVLDTGMDLEHPDLEPNLWRNPGEVPGTGRDDDGNGYVDDVHGWDFVDGVPISRSRSDGAIHGTHIAGTIAAVADNGIGVVGVAPEVRVMPLRVIGEDGTGELADVVAAIGYAVENGATVANLSWGGPSHSRLLRDALAAAAAITVVAATGNSTQDLDEQPVYPASYMMPHLISVTAVDSRGNLPSWANVGANSVHLAGPGHDILSTVPPDPASGAVSYGWLSGTSMAAPHVAGTLALLASARPAAPPATLVRSVLGTARPLPSLAGTTITGGMVDAGRAMGRLLTCPEDVPQAPFADVRLTAHEESIACASWRELTSGYTDGTFRPHEPVTRAQVASTLHRLLEQVGAPVDDGPARFADVTSGPHADAINALAEAGIIRGVTADRFDPATSVTRAQLAALLVRLHDHVTDEALPVPSSHPFRDVRGTALEDEIAAGWDAGLVQGRSASSYDPKAAVSRGQMASFLVRLFPLLAD
jgi:subtilisin family serine protease